MHLSPELRARIGSRFATPVLNYYSCSETGPAAWECLAAPGRFHVLLPDVFAESVGGELVVTRLRESVLPLLRYRTGDAGQVEPEDCRCGHRGISIVGLSGRRACRFTTPDGRAVDAWRLAWVFQHHPLDGFRLTQETAERFRLETAGDPSEGAARLVERLRATLIALGWRAPRIDHARVRREALAAAKPEPFAIARDVIARGASPARPEQFLTIPFALPDRSSPSGSSSSLSAAPFPRKDD
jgi:phenylacetate-CoA ligase